MRGHLICLSGEWELLLSRPRQDVYWPRQRQLGQNKPHHHSHEFRANTSYVVTAAQYCISTTVMVWLTTGSTRLATCFKLLSIALKLGASKLYLCIYFHVMSNSNNSHGHYTQNQQRGRNNFVQAELYVWLSGRCARLDVDAGCQDIKSISYLDGFIPRTMLWASWPDTGTVSTHPNFSHECISGMDRIHWIPHTDVCQWLCNKKARISECSDVVCTQYNGCVVCVTTGILFSISISATVACLLLPLTTRILPFSFNSKEICGLALLLPAQNRHWSPFFHCPPM